MGRKRGIHCIVLISAAIAIMLLAAGCSQNEGPGKTEVRITFGSPQSRALDPDEEKISDISLMIFDESGAAEACLYLEDGITECSARLVTGRKYIVCACANFGYQVYAGSLSELEGLTYHLAYPDEYSQGMPMYAYHEVTISGNEIPVTLGRLMAKISLQVDRSLLSDDVEMFVRSVRIGNCPRSVKVFGESRVENEDGCFPAGFSRLESETEYLNSISESGMSDAISLYMLENRQRDIPDDELKKSVCSYIEMELDYLSENYYSTGRGLVYRFYLKGEGNGYDIERNCHYHVTVTPEDDGLSEDSWRVDRTSLTYCGPIYLRQHPSDYIVGEVGDRIHIWCELMPADAPFDVGISDLEFDKEHGIYDYVIDEDGHGAVLTLKNAGTGLIYMEAGEPVNDAALFFIEVNQSQLVSASPTDTPQYETPDSLQAAPECRQRQVLLRRHRPQVRGQ